MDFRLYTFWKDERPKKKFRRCIELSLRRARELNRCMRKQLPALTLLEMLQELRDNSEQIKAKEQEK